MGTWNYKVCKETLTQGNNKECVFDIREVCYNGLGEIYAVTEIGAAAQGESLGDIVDALKLMLHACESPIVDLDNIVYAGGWVWL